MQAIAEFQLLVGNIHKCSKAIEKAINAMAASKTCPQLARDQKSNVPGFDSLCDIITQHQKKAGPIFVTSSLHLIASKFFYSK